MIDDKLIKALKGGDKESFRKLIDSSYSLYFSFALALVKDREAAKDILQDVFLKLYLHRQDIDETMNLRNYLFKSVRLEVKNHLRLAFNARRKDGFPEDRLIADLYNVIYYDDTVSSVNDALAAMPPVRKAVFVMSRMDGRSNAEIAARLGISVRTVEKHIELAKRDLRESLHETLQGRGS